MSVREFDNTDDILDVDDGGIGALDAVGLSFMVLLKPTNVGVGGTKPIICPGAAGVAIAAMCNDATRIEYADSDDFAQAECGVTTGAWQILGMKEAAGDVIYRGHRKVLGSGSWTHANSGRVVVPQTNVPTLIEFGGFSGAGSGKMNARIAVAAIWTTNLADADYANIESNATTAYLASLSPFALWEFNQASTATNVTDLIGSCDQTAITGTTVVEGDDPTWTFGLAAAEKQSFYTSRRRGWR